MKLDDILKMEAGPELNKLVGETLNLGYDIEWQVLNKTEKGCIIWFDNRIQAEEWWERNKHYAENPNSLEYGMKMRTVLKWHDFSRNMSYAFSVIEKLMSMGYRYVARGNFAGNRLHFAAFDHQDWADPNPLYKSNLCKSLPLAICQAALITVFTERSELEE